MIDNNHLLRKIDSLNDSRILQDVEDKTIIHVSWDVVAMFPNMPKDLGLAKCREELNKREDGLSTECVIEGLEICLDYNISEFDNEWYRQAYGAAIGPHEASFYCDITMTYIDNLVNSDSNPHKRPTAWFRFRDDVYDPWKHGEVELIKFTEWLNTLHPRIKFTVTYKLGEGVEYLDTYIYDIDGVIHTKIHSKESDTHAYLPPTSCHPYHICKNNPSQVARRVRKLNSEECNYLVAREDFSEHLALRGYSTSSINEAFEKFDNIDRSSLYSTKEHQSTKKCYPLVTQFNPHLPKIPPILEKYKFLLKIDKVVESAIPEGSIFSSYSQPKNIKDILIRSRFSSESAGTKAGICKKCKNCFLCKHFLVETKSFKSFECEETYNIKEELTCITEGIIYLILGLKCKKSYVGSTIGNMRSRASNYKNHILIQYEGCEIAKHFAEVGPDIHPIDNSNGTTKTEQRENYNVNISQQINIIIIDKVNLDNCKNTREKRELIEIKEGYWQTQLRTLIRYGGLNKRDDRKNTNKRKAGVKISNSQPEPNANKDGELSGSPPKLPSSCPPLNIGVRRSSRLSQKS